MTEKEIKVLLSAAKRAGLNPSKLHPRNPWTLQGPVAESLQLSLTSVDPELAQQWQQEAGVGLSLAAIAVQKGVEPLTAETLAEFQQKAPADVIEAQKAREADMFIKTNSSGHELSGVDMTTVGSGGGSYDSFYDLTSEGTTIANYQQGGDMHQGDSTNLI